MEDFVDYYELLQISQNAELQTIQRVYRMLASRYHPDNPETGDTERFVRLKQAYEVLSDHGKRTAYDEEWNKASIQPMPIFEMKEFVIGIDAEVNRRLGILCLLYNRRRESPDKPSMSLLEMEAKMSVPREHLEFTIWYLRERQLARRDEATSEVVITAEGVDFVEANRPSNRIVHKLLKSADGKVNGKE